MKRAPIVLLILAALALGVLFALYAGAGTLFYRF